MHGIKLHRQFKSLLFRSTVIKIEKAPIFNVKNVYHNVYEYIVSSSVVE